MRRSFCQTCCVAFCKMVCCAASLKSLLIITPGQLTVTKKMKIAVTNASGPHPAAPIPNVTIDAGLAMVAVMVSLDARPTRNHSCARCPAASGGSVASTSPTRDGGLELLVTCGGHQWIPSHHFLSASIASGHLQAIRVCCHATARVSSIVAHAQVCVCVYVCVCVSVSVSVSVSVCDVWHCFRAVLPTNTNCSKHQQAGGRPTICASAWCVRSCALS